MPQSEESRDRLEARDWTWWSEYYKGSTQQAIADKYGTTQQLVSLRLKLVRESLPETDRDEMRQKHLAEMASLSKEWWDLVHAPPMPAYSNGRLMTVPNPIDPDSQGTPVWDHSARLAAGDRILKIQERMSKLMGLDAATKQEVVADHVVRYDIPGLDPKDLT